jgi:hypothetical protein
MNDIFLTFNLNVNEPCFDYLTDVYKINSADLLGKYSYDILKHTSHQRLSFIAEGILQSDESIGILVGSAGYNYTDFMTIHTMLQKKGRAITAIFIPSQDRLASDLKEGQEIYRQHNRWLDYPPGHIENVHEERLKIIREIAMRFMRTGVKIIEK